MYDAKSAIAPLLTPANRSALRLINKSGGPQRRRAHASGRIYKAMRRNRSHELSMKAGSIW
jgi:hypothetical protein